jgi:hypothetical protein
MIRNLELISRMINQGQINIGMTREQLHDLLGTPDEEGGDSKTYRAPCIFKYGDIQFVFPVSRSVNKSRQQGLQYVYIDDAGEVETPLFLLQ